MKIRIIIFLSFVLSSLSLFDMSVFAECPSVEASAQEFIQGCSQGTSGVGVTSVSNGINGIKDTVIKVSEKALRYGALFAIGMIVWSGIKYTTAYGDDEKIKSAKSTAIYALIGLILMLVAFPMVDMVVNFVYSFNS